MTQELDQRFDQLCKDLSLSKEALAVNLGASKATLYNWMRKPETMPQLAREKLDQLEGQAAGLLPKESIKGQKKPTAGVVREDNDSMRSIYQTNRPTPEAMEELAAFLLIEILGRPEAYQLAARLVSEAAAGDSAAGRKASKILQLLEEHS